MIRVNLFEDTNIETFAEVRSAYIWCRNRMGDPGEDWSYGKNLGFLDKDIISSPEEIEFLMFKNEEDAVAFKLSH